MFVGHEFLAFALAGLGALRAGFDDRAALHVGAVAALAALLPDLDVVYAVATYAVAVAGGTPIGWEAFWGVANATHRVVTHTLPTGGVATLTLGSAVGVARWRTGGRTRPARSGGVATAAFAAVAAVGVAILLAGFRAAVSPSAAAVAAGFLGCVAAAGWLLAARTDLSTATVTAAAGVGFLSHPFGDVLLAAPPPLLSPFGPTVWTARVSLAADPTLDLLGVLFVEVAAVWAGLAVFARVGAGRLGRPRRLRDTVDPRALTGFAYAPAAVVLPQPTIVDAHVLGATIVPFAGLVGFWAGYASPRRDGVTGRPGDAASRFGPAYVGVVTGVAALAAAAVAYTAVYLVV